MFFLFPSISEAHLSRWWLQITYYTTTLVTLEGVHVLFCLERELYRCWFWNYETSIVNYPVDTGNGWTIILRWFRDSPQIIYPSIMRIHLHVWSTVWYISGQIIAPSHDRTPNGGLEREIRLFQGNLGWWSIIIWPDIYMKGLFLYVFCDGKKCRQTWPPFVPHGLNPSNPWSRPRNGSNAVGAALGGGNRQQVRRRAVGRTLECLGVLFLHLTVG